MRSIASCGRIRQRARAAASRNSAPRTRRASATTSRPTPSARALRPRRGAPPPPAAAWPHAQCRCGRPTATPTALPTLVTGAPSCVHTSICVAQAQARSSTPSTDTHVTFAHTRAAPPCTAHTRPECSCVCGGSDAHPCADHINTDVRADPCAHDASADDRRAHHDGADHARAVGCAGTSTLLHTLTYIHSTTASASPAPPPTHTYRHAHTHTHTDTLKHTRHTRARTHTVARACGAEQP